MSQAVSDYLAAFDLVALSADGQRDSRKAAWWCSAADVERLTEHTRCHGCGIPAAAKTLGILVTEHEVVMARVATAAKKIDAAIQWARRTGGLAEINAEYKRRRVAAEQRGERFIDYGELQRRLRIAFARVAAGGEIPASLMARVFADMTLT
jgi:hypothetical protein